MSKLRVAQDGPEKDLPKKKAVKKSGANSRIEMLTQKIQVAKDLEKLVKGREIFQVKLDQVNEALNEIIPRTGEAWDSEKDFRVSFEGGQYSTKSILSFTQRGLIVEFLNFMVSRIGDKLSEIDEQILSSSI